MPKQPAVYILSNRANGTLYVGVTSNLVQRVYQHRAGEAEGFTQRYDLKMLVYYELFEDMSNAILSEKRLKRWRRSWKIKLIEEKNPEWRDLWANIVG